MTDKYSRAEFMSLTTEQIASMIKEAGIPKVGVLIPDGTRKIGAICYGLNVNSKDFESTLFKQVNEDLMKVVKDFFDHGLHTLFVPCLTNGNLKRNKDYVDKAVKVGLNYIFQSKNWYKFYDENGIRVKTYGDISLLDEMGYSYVKKWIEEVQGRTEKNELHELYFGIGCSNREEHDRLMDYAISFQKEHGRKPTREEQIDWYYQGYVDDVDFFIRPTILRDSDVQPPLISGVKTQMYFPIAPFPFLDKEMIRQILFDLLYSRTITYGNDTETLDGLDSDKMELIRQYYTINKDVIIGVGERVGDYWLPFNNVKIPKK